MCELVSVYVCLCVFMCAIEMIVNLNKLRNSLLKLYRKTDKNELIIFKYID